MSCVKVIAYYLPQFYEMPENDKWWGKGFTEWTCLRNATPLFPGHQQPIRPVENNYYNLLSKEVVKWQTYLADKYKIYGFAYYHYWFCGKLLLEKPAENLLKWKEIRQKFFFFWANHTWYKSANGKKEILISQEYGSVQDWKNHYQYMRVFYMDERYIKIDNRPVLGIYRFKDIPQINDMLRLWNKMALEDGFSGLYIIESINKIQDITSVFQVKKSDAFVLRQPNLAKGIYNMSLRNFFKSLNRKIYAKTGKVHQKPYIISYEEICRDELKIIEKFANCNIYYCIATGWDNTPRHKNFGEVFLNRSVCVYKSVLKKMYQKAKENEHEFIFINAWNEWAEGMNLEPDNFFGYEFLEATKEVIEEFE